MVFCVYFRGADSWAPWPGCSGSDWIFPELISFVSNFVLFWLQLKTVVVKLVYFHLDENFQVHRTTDILSSTDKNLETQKNPHHFQLPKIFQADS